MPPRVLIVDDESVIRLAVREYLARLGYDVDTAGNLADAWALIRAVDYAAVITDLQLNPGDGWHGIEVIRCVRKRSPQTRVIVVTAHGTSAAGDEARRCGADAVFDKPVPLGKLAELISASPVPGRSR